MLIDIVDIMSTVLDNPVIFLAEAAVSRENELGVESRAPKALLPHWDLFPLGLPDWFS